MFSLCQDGPVVKEADLQLLNLGLLPADKTVPWQSVLEIDTGAGGGGGRVFSTSYTSHYDILKYYFSEPIISH